MGLDLPFFERYKAIFADKLNRIVSELRASTLQPGIGYRVMRTPGGTVLEIDSTSSVPGTSGTYYCPFEVTDATDGEKEQFRIKFGLIGNKIPIGMNQNDDPPLIMDWMDGFVCAEVSFDAANGTVSEVRFAVSEVIKPADTTTAYFPVACLKRVDQKRKILNLCSAITPSVCDLMQISE